MRVSRLTSDAWTTNRDACVKMAESLRENDTEWTYEVVSMYRGDGTAFYRVEIRDEDGLILDRVIPTFSDLILL